MSIIIKQSLLTFQIWLLHPSMKYYQASQKHSRILAIILQRWRQKEMYHF